MRREKRGYRKKADESNLHAAFHDPLFSTYPPSKSFIISDHAHQTILVPRENVRERVAGHGW
jgi:hypothetical protein